MTNKLDTGDDITKLAKRALELSEKATKGPVV